jgi:hypothetical protein
LSISLSLMTEQRVAQKLIGCALFHSRGEITAEFGLFLIRGLKKNKKGRFFCQSALSR